MPGRVFADDLEFAGIKWIGSGGHNYELGYPRASALVILNHPVTKLPICIADGTAVSVTRTGAAGGVAVALLSRKDSFEANTQKYVNEVSTVYPEIQFRTVTEEELGNCVRESDIVITATTTDRPFIKAEWVKAGTLLINMASDEMEREWILKDLFLTLKICCIPGFCKM